MPMWFALQKLESEPRFNWQLDDLDPGLVGFLT